MMITNVCDYSSHTDYNQCNILKFNFNILRTCTLLVFTTINNLTNGILILYTQNGEKRISDYGDMLCI